MEPNNERVNVQVKIEAAKKLPGIGPVVDLDGNMDLKLNPAFRMDLGVALNVLSFEIARADATITKSSFSTTININAVILHGTASINAWSTDGKFHFTGSGRMAIEVRKGSISETCTDMPCGSVQGWLGHPVSVWLRLCPLCLSFPPFTQAGWPKSAWTWVSSPTAAMASKAMWRPGSEPSASMWTRTAT